MSLSSPDGISANGVSLLQALRLSTTTIAAGNASQDVKASSVRTKTTYGGTSLNQVTSPSFC